MIQQKSTVLALRMRAIIGFAAGSLLGLTILFCCSVFAQHTAASRARAALAPANVAAPNDAPHALLLKLTGEYNRVVKFVGQAGAMAAPSSGTCKISGVLGGRFILEESHDTVFGKPVDGLRIYGYNDATKQYEMARMYTMSNAITLMKGTSSDGGETIDYVGEAGSAGMGSMQLHAKMQQVNADEFTVTMSTVSANGKDTPFQETIYTRKK